MNWERPRRPHPTSCPCQRCENYDVAESFERLEERYATRGVEPPDSRSTEASSRSETARRRISA